MTKDQGSRHVQLKGTKGADATFVLTDGREETLHEERIRSFLITFSEFQCGVTASSDTWTDESPIGPFKSYVTAKATLRDDIAVIGEPDTLTRTLPVYFHGVDNASADRSNSDEGAHESSTTDKTPAQRPTATLYYDRANWEIGKKAGWGLWIDLPLTTCMQLVEVVQSRTISSGKARLKLMGAYVDDQWAPPSESVHWYLFPGPDKGDEQLPKPIRGRIESISLVHEVVKVGADDGPSEAELPAPTPSDPMLDTMRLIPSNFAALATRIGELKNAVWVVGLAIAVILLFR